MIVEVRNNATGEIRSFDYEPSYLVTPSDGFDEWLWTEGNYSCDCNRALFFARANGEPDPNEPCMPEGRFSIRITDGRDVLLDEISPARDELGG
jgi:hypothetical protein